MSVARLSEWRLPGCDGRCWPRLHDPEAHEAYGREIEREQARRSVVRTGPLVVDLAARRALVREREARLSPREWALLAHLAERVGRRCLIEEVVRGAWGPEYLSPRMYLRPDGEGAYRADFHALRVVCHRLRRRLGDAGRLVMSVPGFLWLEQEPAP